MKKLFAVVMGLAMILTMARPVLAQEKSIEKLGSNEQVENTSKSFLVDYAGKPGRVFYGSNGIDIVCEDETIHLATNYAVVKLLPVKDVNNDGYIDFVVNETTPDLSDNFMVISGKDGSILTSRCLTRIGYESNGEVYIETTVNTTVLMMIDNADSVIVLYDYTIECIDLSTGETIYKYVNEDNVWDLEVVDSRLAFVDQLGRLGFIDLATGELLSIEGIGELYHITTEWDENKQFDIQMNLWDLFKDGNCLYITSEDGNLFRYHLDSEEIDTLYLDIMDADTYRNSLNYQYTWVNGKVVGLNTGINDGAFRGYRVVDSNEQYLLVSAYVYDENALSRDYNFYDYQAYLLVDKTTFEIVNKQSLNSHADIVDCCISEYNGQLALSTIYAEDNTSMRLEVRDLDGIILNQKSLDIISSENGFVDLSYADGSYLVESYGGCCCVISPELTVDYYFTTVTTKLVGLNDQDITLLYTENGNGTKLVNYKLDCSTVNWQYDTKVEGNTKGIEFVLCEDYNNDGVKDYICIANIYNDKNEVSYSYYIVVDGTNGNQLVNARIYQYTDYDEKGRPFKVYLSSESVELIKDIDGDNKKEFLVSGNIISSRSLSIKGSVATWIDFDGVTNPIGDVNGDGFTDYIGVSDTVAVIFNSKRSGYNVTYSKTSISTKLNKNWHNSSYSKLIGDVNNDGVKEFVVATETGEGYQTFDLYDGKTLTKMYCLYPNGVCDYEQLRVLDLDVNNDGYNELIIYNSYFGVYGLTDGQTGKKLHYFNLWGEKEDSVTVEQVEEETNFWRPDYPVVLEELSEGTFAVSSFADQDGDGVDDIAIVKNYWSDEDWNQYQSVLIYSTQNYEIVREITLAVNSSSECTMKSINNSENLKIISTENGINLMDIQSSEVKAQYNLKGTNFTQIDENTLLVGDEKGNLYSLDMQKTFKITSDIPEEIGDYILTVSWEKAQANGVMTITDNGSVVYTGVDTSCDLKLTEGTHSLIFSLYDGQGKNSKEGYAIEVTRQSTKMDMFGIGIAIFMVAGAFFLNMRRKQYIKKVAKEGLK